MTKIPLPRTRRVPEATKKALEDYRREHPAPRSPCAGQTAEEIESYYRHKPEGAAAAIRRTHGGILTYEIATVGHRTSRCVYVGSGGYFYMKSGKNRHEPTGQTRLVVPTAEVVAWAKEHPRGETGYSTRPGN